MKKLFFSLVLFLVMLMIGCQENSLTDPILAGSDNKANTNIPGQIRGSIQLDGILKVPGKLNTYYSIKGTVDYTDQIFYIDATSPSPRHYIKVSLSASGTLNNSPMPDLSLEHNLWYFSSNSEDNLSTAIDGKYKIVKVYPIKGRTDGLVLVCQYLITTNSVQLEGKWLSYLVDNSKDSFSTF